MHSTPSARLSIAALLGALALGAGCTAAEAPAEPAEPSELATRGEQIFTNVVEDGNTFTCATCHAISEPVLDGIRRVGHPLFDAARRPTYKNGQLTELRDAANSCLQEWMNAEPWTADDGRWLALEEYLESVAPDEEAEPLRFEVVDPPPVSALGGGDPEAGRALFNRSCSACHGEDGIGSQLAIPVGGRGLDPEYVAERVRTSGRTESEVYDGLTGGVMPFWAADRLDDDELRDLIAWLEIEQAPVDPPDPVDPPNDPTDPPGPSNCAATHPMVGATAILEENFHDVGGIARIVDDCTIEITEFTFDGEGIDVRLYGGLDGNYDDGFAIGDNLLRPGGYSGETLTFTLPPERTMDDLDGVSVWCVPVGVDFGSGRFEQ